MWLGEIPGRLAQLQKQHQCDIKTRRKNVKRVSKKKKKNRKKSRRRNYNDLTLMLCSVGANCNSTAIKSGNSSSSNNKDNWAKDVSEWGWHGLSQREGGQGLTAALEQRQNMFPTWLQSQFSLLLLLSLQGKWAGKMLMRGWWREGGRSRAREWINEWKCKASVCRGPWREVGWAAGEAVASLLHRERVGGLGARAEV